ncbi:bifunctional indole-3-glycerol-phosphate synthase TrpC/phosphoribosylanthranilate isomerase TrpF [Psychrobium sp. 1_MG-2023]|uniref:bifunctional indole-3-glycerol-phosphate synthase TrpC/phosphoribosylanthranilate isomerase TrpF n=1 Tax=Psychrobium sp. 1_MG-2023 TaxID=3062624 RepID=UPI000C336190|nr:bifunctional indole-3-glycerol-phosphate synthase TrpC/phosphoribosylanthranilate isomerase TrpF [Psychrobium sp. 1_MG-2023]MDP2560233.1 bifunctional indole-3-glycerol-phosphate synthase TrpC/phosphoribosylanthranilate isomerase TrpF [Psychrobium sp. 1_MG-2023]PKF57043.1 bifunctional indole-3-glycerol-phosphate synthase TrpC/phosphoribosylanthranilate isomerase TrpF [Alteromonadales bacterium alter-6D02]
MNSERIIAGTKITGTVLDQIVADKAPQLARLENEYPKADISQGLEPSKRSLFDALNAPNASYILECKKASPSKGLIRDEFNLGEICGAYQHYASGVSVLTDEKYFQGRFEYVREVRALIEQPILCKDFFIDPYQILLARYMGADAILLMLSVLDDDKYRALSDFAAQYHMDILTEVSNQEELERALALDAKIIGINNRDLRDLSIDLNTTKKLAPQIGDDRVIISESGISTHQQILNLSPFVQGFLVGSSLMEQPNIDLACRELIYGQTKICGMTNPETAIAAAAAGAVYGGLIFAPKSPRYITVGTAREIIDSAALRFVGVFVSEAVEKVAEIANELTLDVVQLHGGEDQAYIEQLKPLLPASCQIWLALRSDKLCEDTHYQIVDRLLIDSAVTTDHNIQFGGTGHTFDWEKVAKPTREQAMLAGGLSPDNIKLAANCGFLGLDVNSGVESSPGVKDLVQIKRLMQQIRAY